MSDNHDTLVSKVLELSYANDWEHARDEWDVIAYRDLAEETCGADGREPKPPETCVCGHEGIRRCYTIFNRVTKKPLAPIGSKCVRQFQRGHMDRQAKAIAAAYRAERFVASIAPNEEVPLRRGEPGWKKNTMTPSAIHALWSRRYFDPVDDLDAVRDCDDALECIMAAAWGKYDPDMLRWAHALFEYRARPRIMALLPPE